MSAVKAAILIHEDDSITHVQRTIVDAKFNAGEQSTFGVLVNGKLIETNPATGKPITTVPEYVSELATLLTGKQSVDAGKANPTQTDDKTPVREVTLRPGDALPVPGPHMTILAHLEHPLGIGSYRWNVPAGVSGRGWIKGRSETGDDFSVRYALLLGRPTEAQLGSPVGSMELPINFDAGEKDGMSNTPSGFNGVLTLDNVSGQPIVLQITRD